MKTRFGACVVVVVSSLGLSLVAAQNPPPTFSAGTNLVQVDTTVLNGKRQPIRGLGAADFVVLEDGKPRPIETFVEVDLPPTPVVRPASASPTRPPAVPLVPSGAPSDEGRLVVILMDRTIRLGQPSMTARTIAEAAIANLGPGDLGAVVFTGTGLSLPFTADRARLVRAIEGSIGSIASSEDAREVEGHLASESPDGLRPLPSMDGRCYCGACVPDTIAGVANAVRDITKRRKVLLFIGSSLVVQAPDVECSFRLKDARERMLLAVERANLTVHSISPDGLELVGPIGQTSSSVRGGRAGASRLSEMSDTLGRNESLNLLPARTGGRVVLNANAPETFVADIYAETASYYIIGFTPAAADGRFHDIKVTVRQKGARVHARSGYLAQASAAR